MIYLLVALFIAATTCLIYLVSAIDRLSESVGRSGERLKRIEEFVDAIKRTLGVRDDAI